MTFNPTLALEQALAGHGLRTVETEQGISIAGSDLALSVGVVRAQRHATATTVQLDVRAMSERLGGKLLIESFGGSGSDETEAAEQAFRKFLMASMHVLLAVFVDPKHGEGQVEWESWTLEGKTWKVCMGPLIRQGESPGDLVCGDLLDMLKIELIPTLSDGTHWLRLFVRTNGNELVASEALLDNLEWPQGRKTVEVFDWPAGMYSARLFLMLC